MPRVPSGLQLADYQPPHPFRREGLAARVLPFGVPALLGFVAVLDRIPTAARPEWLFAAMALTLAIMVVTFLLPWPRLPHWCAALPPLAYVVAVFLMRHGAGIHHQHVAPLLILPLFWLALHGTRGHLIAGFALTVGTAVLSRQLGEVRADDFRFQFLAFMVMTVVCLTAQGLMRQVREQAMQLGALSRVDVLTGASNRRDWEVRLPAEMARARRDGRPICVAMIDLDHFKRLNDEKGHLAGDRVLRESVEAWGRILRGTDVLARYGGEEFAVLLPTCPLEQALAVVERLRAATAGGQTCSAGVAEWDGKESAQVLVARADAALYQAKAQGRNRTVVASATDSARRRALVMVG